MNSLAADHAIENSDIKRHAALPFIKTCNFSQLANVEIFFCKVFFSQQIFNSFFYQTATNLHCVAVCLFFNGIPPNLKIENIAPRNLMSKHKMCALTSYLSHSAFLHPSIILIVLPFVDRLRAFLSALFLGAAKGSGYQQSE